jgi:arylsulfatase A-like enzyme
LKLFSICLVTSLSIPWCAEHVLGVTTTPNDTHESFFLANKACEKLEELAKDDGDEPFHLRVDFWGPHQPFFPTQEFLDMYNPEDIPIYGNFFDDLKNKPAVHRTDINAKISKDLKLILPSPIDWSIWQQMLARAYAQQTMIDVAGGIVIDRLKELGLDENTLIIWCADHGDAIASHGGHFDKCSYMSEEVMRIPMAMRWPLKIKEGTKVESFATNLDVPTTILAAGESFKNSVDCKNLLNAIDDEESNGRKSMMLEAYGHGYAERIQARMYLEGDYKYVSFDGEMEELYNLKADPYEMDNLACKEMYQEKKKQMIESLKVLQVQSKDPFTLNPGKCNAIAKDVR